MNTENMLYRAYAHWLEDGLPEIWGGILLAGVGALRATIHFAGAGTAAYYWLTGGLFVFMLGVGGGGGYVVKLLKGRITYARTGYTAFKPYTPNYMRLLVLLIFAGILGGAVGVLATQPNQQEIGGIVPIGQGIAGALFLTYAARRVEVRRLYYLAAFSIGIGLVIGAYGVGVVLGVSIFYLSIGLAMIVSGCVALVHYLRSHEPVDLSGNSQ